MIYDRADWHYNGDYPEELPPENGGTHIGFFFTWLLNHHLESEQLVLEFSDELDRVRQRELSGREFLLRKKHGQLDAESINELGNAFTRYYYDSDIYFTDYANTLVGELQSLYHVEENWQNYDIIAALIDKRFAAWQRSQRRAWWKFW